MAKRRMFSSDIVDSDIFLEMPTSSRCLYYDLGMRADDDGFVNPRKVLRLTNASEDDLKVLVAKKLVIPFESGVIVIKDWKMNNYIQRDRYTPTIYKEERSSLIEDSNGSYELYPKSIQNVYKMDTQVRLGKDINTEQIKEDKTPETPTSNNLKRLELHIDDSEMITNFDQFWSAYPVKKSKSKAKMIYMKLVGNDPSLSQAILDAIEAQKKEREANKIAGKFVPEWKHPTTWLNQGCWEDEVTYTEQHAESVHYL